MLVEITVVPNSPKFMIVKKDGRLKLHLKSAPEGNKANVELIKELEKILGKPVRIVAGAKSKKKRIEVDESRWKELLASL